MSAQLTVNFTLSGYITSLTLDGENGVELLGKVGAVVKKLGELGAMPTATAPTANGNSTTAQAESKVCPIHHTPMKRRTGKGGDVWYSHKAVNPDTGAEYWCRGKA